MKKFIALFSLFAFFAFTGNAQDPAGCIPLGTPGVTLDPLSVPMFQNDLPVIRDLGLRVKLSKGRRGSQNIEVSMEETFQDVLGMGFQTRLWGYKFPGFPAATYPGATIVANRDKPVTIKWTNNLPGHFLPVDASSKLSLSMRSRAAICRARLRDRVGSSF